MSLQDVNEWVLAHQALIVAVGIPLLTVLVAAIVSVLTNLASLKSQKRQRQLEIELKLAEFRQGWINDLRNDISQVSALATVQMVHDGNPREEQTAEWSAALSRIILRLNPNDPDFEKLQAALSYDIDGFLGKSPKRQGETSTKITARILKNEWDRLKSDLRRIEGMSQK